MVQYVLAAGIGLSPRPAGVGAMAQRARMPEVGRAGRPNHVR